MEPSPRQYIAAELRAELGRQQKLKNEVGRVIGRLRGKATISRQATAAKLSGDVAFTPEELVALAQWLKVPVARFLPDTVDVAS